VPIRSRKLLPRLVTAEPAETVELIIVADGVGVGEGDGEGEGVGVGDAVGVGVGVGVGVTCACAEDTPMASTKTTQANRAKARLAPILSVRDAQRMNSIPEKKRPLEILREKPARWLPICAQFLRSVNRLRSRPATE
jgi:hypothetical protein